MKSQSSVSSDKYMITMTTDWASLKTDILEAIAKLLSVEDYIRAQAVCGPWQSVLKETPFKPKPHHQLPWLMLPEDSSDICRFYSFYDRKVHTKELPELCGRRCCGSSCGWMVMVDKSPDVFLLNPVTRSQIQLPPITTFPEIVGFGVSELGREEYIFRNDLGDEERRSGEFMKYCFFDKVTVVENPFPSGGYMAMGIYGDLGHLAFCREGDQRWTLVHQQDELIFFYDVVYWKGNFYAVDSAGTLVVCDLEGPVPKFRIILTPQPAIIGDKNYLVVSGDVLLLVSRRLKSCFRNVNSINCHGHDIDENVDHANSHNYNFFEDEDDDNGDDVDDKDNNNEDEDDDNGDIVDDIDYNMDDDNGDGVDDNDYNNEDEDVDNRDGVDDNEDGDNGGEVYLYKTSDFKVFEFDEEVLTWTKVTSLQNRMLFVGNNFALSLCANDFPQCKANYIYFTDDCTHGHMNYIMGASTALTAGHDLGAYDMKDGKIEPFSCCPEVTWLLWPPPFWATLSL
ncbi:F-box protein SKIP23-like [Tripterygium wilfordii]|uniref:F-box protein SKIP23-like n=1 Tax=Tripterygium wilfordii TaxID=458696 RepID=A0A7J7DIG7_TRIWF|nr:putative F-box protein At4g22660 isoform X2 [Tripterygium wilfordii]KAF5746152.1 F-box protein SKIP23-like [Tripterygium wilfordii]